MIFALYYFIIVCVLQLLHDEIVRKEKFL